MTDFDGVAGRVAEVQDAPRAGFALVGRDDRGLDAARLADHRRQRLFVLGEDRRALAADPVEERRDSTSCRT